LFDVVQVREVLPEQQLAGGEGGTVVEVLDRSMRIWWISRQATRTLPTLACQSSPSPPTSWFLVSSG
jgi:hypothetical protein